jgi:small subunit ribosomal protein S8
MQTDPIADLLTRIRNASSVRHEEVKVPYSKIKEEIVKILGDEGFITGFSVGGVAGTVKKEMKVTLKYSCNDEPVIRGLERVSRPGLRVYVKHQKIPRVLNGLGVAILSTSKGIKSGETSRKENLGGEYLCRVW